MTAPTSTMTLSEALEHTYRTRWAHARDGGKCLYSQAKAAVLGLTGWHNVDHDRITHATRPAKAAFLVSEDTEVRMVPPDAVRSATARWYALGLSPATITKRLNCLSAMGVSVGGMRPAKERNLKWWLRPEEEEKVVDLLTRHWLTVSYGGPPLIPGLEAFEATALSWHIQWTTKTGLRVEETLRLAPGDFGDDCASVTVPGTKTADSQATLPLGTAAQALAVRRHPVYFKDYTQLEASWRKLRAAMGWPQAATLKALRRSAARYLHVDCGMPLHMVQQYLRHENIQTTLDYLRLTGGYGTEEMRRYLK